MNLLQAAMGCCVSSSAPMAGAAVSTGCLPAAAAIMVCLQLYRFYPRTTDPRVRLQR
jgi:hypothetical protein